MNNPKIFKIFIDNSISMLDSVKYKNKIISQIDLSKKFTNELQSISKIELRKKLVNEYTFLFSDDSKLNFEQFKFNPVFDESQDQLNYASIVFTDGNNPVEKINYNGASPVYVIPLGKNINDGFIKNANYNNGNLTIEIINNTDSNKGEISVSNNDIKIFNTSLNLKKGENLFNFSIDKKKIREKALKISLNLNTAETNKINNIFYVRCQKEEEKQQVFLFFSRPSFDTRFLIRALSLTDKYNLNINIPKHGEKLVFPKIPDDSIVFAGDFIVENLVNIENLYTFVKNRGTLIYLNRNTKLDKNIPLALRNILPFTTDNIMQIQNQDHFIPTETGMKLSYINFKDKNLAIKIWKNFSSHNLPNFLVIPNNNAEILLKKGNFPAIIKQKIGKGNVISVLFYPLWTFDFKNVGFGSASYYFDIFISELIETSRTIPLELIYVAEPVKELREQIELIAHPSISQDLLNKKIIVNMKSNNNIIQANFINESGLIKSKVLLPEHGIWQVYLSNNKNPVTKVFVNYPQNELTTGKIDQNLTNITANNPNVSIKTYAEIQEIVRNAKKEFVSYSVTESIAITSFIIYALIALSVILLAWYVKSSM